MEKGKEISQVELLYLLPLLFFDKTAKQELNVSGMKYLISKGGAVLSINGNLPKILFSKNGFYVYQLNPDMSVIKIVKERQAEVKALPDRQSVQGEYNSYVLSLMFRDLVLGAIIIAIAFWIVPKIVLGIKQLTQTTIPALSPSIVKVGSRIEVMKDGWIKEKICEIPKGDIVAYRKQIRFNRAGRKHYFVFVKHKNGKWYLYEIIHPPSETPEYVFARSREYSYCP